MTLQAAALEAQQCEPKQWFPSWQNGRDQYHVGGAKLFGHVRKRSASDESHWLTALTDENHYPSPHLMLPRV